MINSSIKLYLVSVVFWENLLKKKHKKKTMTFELEKRKYPLKNIFLLKM